jgi:hypothetical protein
VTFTSRQNSTFEPEVTYQFDIFNVPNRVKVILESEWGNDEAIAVNDSPDNPYSTIARGRVIDYVEKIADNDAEDIDLAQRAKQILVDKTSAVESIDIKHVYWPYEVGNAARLIYAEHDFDFVGVCVSKKIDLVHGMPCSAQFNRFVRL